MSLTAPFNINGLRIISGELVLPLSGLWSFTGQVDLGGDPVLTMPPLGEPAILSLGREDAPPAIYLGAVRDAADWQQRGGIRVVAGAGGLSVPLPPQGYSSHPTSVSMLEILNDVCALTFEQLSQETQDFAGGQSYSRWDRVGDGVAVLDALAEDNGVDWRCNPDGTIRLAPEEWPESTPENFYDMGDEGVDGIIECAPDDATIVPGMTVLGKKITDVIYRIEERSLRASLYYHGGQVAEFRSAVRRQVPELPFLPPREGTVVKQNGDGTLQVKTVDMGTLDRVPLLVGLPATKVTMNGGERVRLWFADGSPALYFASEIEQDDDARVGIARNGHAINAGNLSVKNAPQGQPPAVIFIYTPHVTGTDVAIPVIFVIPTMTVSPEVQFDLTGHIIEGHPRLKITTEQ